MFKGRREAIMAAVERVSGRGVWEGLGVIRPVKEQKIVLCRAFSEEKKTFWRVLSKGITKFAFVF